MKVSQQIVLIISVLLYLLLSPALEANAQSGKIGINKVVIDAGHGGKDPGTTWGKLREKDITLAVALKLGALINKHYPDVNVIYTRKTDVFVELYERGNIANKAGADLFISIHINSAKNRAASGTETLVMGMDKAGKNLDVAMKENDVIVYEKDYTANYQGYTPGSAESFIMFSLMQFSYQGQSLTLADMIQKQFSKNTKMSNRGVKQAPVLVLWHSAMPSILAEFGFLSHPTEGPYINSEKGRNMYAQCLFNAFSEYKAHAEGHSTPIILDEVGRNDDTAQTQSTVTSTASEKSGTNSVQQSKSRKIIYKVQVASSPKKIAKNASVFSIYRGQCEERIINNTYKYYIGAVSSYEEALSLQRKIRQHIKDAFVVAFSNGEPISVNEARKIKN